MTVVGLRRGGRRGRRRVVPAGKCVPRTPQRRRGHKGRRPGLERDVSPCAHAHGAGQGPGFPGGTGPVGHEGAGMALSSRSSSGCTPAQGQPGSWPAGTPAPGRWAPGPGRSGPAFRARWWRHRPPGLPGWRCAWGPGDDSAGAGLGAGPGVISGNRPEAFPALMTVVPVAFGSGMGQGRAVGGMAGKMPGRATERGDRAGDHDEADPAVIGIGHRPDARRAPAGHQGPGRQRIRRLRAAAVRDSHACPRDGLTQPPDRGRALVGTIVPQQ